MLHEHLPYVVMEGLNKVLLRIGVWGWGRVIQWTELECKGGLGLGRKSVAR